MRRLTIIMTGADRERFRDALQVGAAWAALDRPVQMFLQGEAVRLLVPAGPEADSAGQPGLAELYEEAGALGVTFTACQSGLAFAALRAEALPGGVSVGGLVSVLAEAAEDQLLFV